MKVSSLYSYAIFTTALLLPPTLMAGPLNRYIWSDSKGLVAADAACTSDPSETVPLYIAQNPQAHLDSYSKLKGTGFFGAFRGGNLLDRSVLYATKVLADNSPANVSVISVPVNAPKPTDVRGFAKRGDDGTVAKDILQEVGNFVLKVTADPSAPTAPPFKLLNSYWQAVLEKDKYVTLMCGDAANARHYIVFDVYDSVGINPVAQVGISGEETKIFENIQVYTPDEANHEPVETPKEGPGKPGQQPAGGGVVKPGVSPPPTPAPGVSPSPSPTPGEEDGEDDAAVGEVDAGLGYILCTTNKTVTVFDKESKATLLVAKQYEDIIPSQSWDEKQKTPNLEVQFPGRQGAKGWVPREMVQLKSDCEPYQKSPHIEKAEDIDLSVVPLDNSISRTDCCKFPTVSRPTQSYAKGILRFRASRSRGRRLHAGVDLYRKKGEPARAVASGLVIRGHYYFYQGVYAVEVKHPKFIARYGEVLGAVPKGIAKGNKVVAGQTVGLIGKVSSGCCSPMLHFELYKGTSRGPLSRLHTPPYDRRPDVMDPTPIVRSWEKNVFGLSF